MVNYRYLGYGITDENGIATLDHDSNGDPITHSYTGTGAGKVDIVASLDDNTHISESSIQSETYSLIDCISFDSGIQGTANNIYSTITGITRTVNPDGTVFTSSSSSAVSFNVKNMGTNSNTFDSPVALEFDLLETDNTNYLNIYTNGNQFINLSELGTGHWIVTFKDRVLTIQVDSRTPVTYSKNVDTMQILFRMNDVGSFKIKNLEVYPI